MSCEPEGKLRKYRKIMSKMKNAITKQTNLSIDVKNGLKELEEVIAANTFSRTLPSYARDISKSTSTAGTTTGRKKESSRIGP